MRSYTLAAICLFACSAATHAQTAPDIYAITNARIIVGNGKTIPQGTIVLRDGILTAVGEKVTIPADATVIDGADCTVYPGLIDGYSHLGMPAPADYPAPRGDTYRIAKVRSDVMATALFMPDPVTLEARRKLGFGAALIAPSVGIFTGTSALFSLGTASGAAAQVLAAPVAMHIDWTAPDVGRGYPSSLMGKIAVTRQALYDAQNAATLLESYAKNPQGRPRPVVPRPIAALIPVVQRKTSVIFHADSAQNIRRVLKLCREFNLRPVIEGGLEAYRVADEMKAEKATVLLSLNLPQVPASPKNGENAASLPENTLQSLRYRANVPRTAALLSQASVPFAFTTSGVESVATALASVRRLIAAGLPEERAVEAFTTAPARLFGVERQLGTVETGKIANILVVAGGSLFDGKGKLRQVFVDGHRVELDTEKPRPNDKPGAVPVAKATVEPEKPIPAPPETGVGPIPALPPALPSAYVLRGATVWTSSAAGTLASTDIYVKEGKIAGVGRELKVPSGTQEIAVVGKQITPGLIDCHSHTAIEGGINEGTNIITAECRVEDIVDPDDVNIYRQLAGGTTAANILHGSANAIGGQNAVVKWRWGKNADQMLFRGAWPGIKFALGENPKQSNFQVPGRARRYPATRMGVEKTIREAFQRARDYQAALAAYKSGKLPTPPPRDLQTETIVELLEGKRVIHSHCYRQDEIVMLIRLAQEYGIRIATLQHVLEGYKVADEMAKANIGGSTFSDWWGYKIEAYDAIPYNAALMSERGVVVSLNSDSDELARRLNLEAAKGVRYGGMAPADALKLVTINPAKQLGIDRFTGSIEVGKDADLVVWSGDPLSTQSLCERTIVDGELYFDRTTDIAGRAAIAVEKRRLMAAEHPEPAPPTPAPAPAVKPAQEAIARLPLPATGSAPATVSPSRRSAREGKGDAAPVTTPIAIVGATVHPISGVEIPDGVIVLQGARIAAVGPAGAVSIPADATVYNAKGQHVYPGLIDAQTTIGLIEIDQYGSTDDTSELGEFNPELRSVVAFNPDSERVGVVRQAGVLTVAAIPRGGIISGVGGLLNTDGWTWEDMTVSPGIGLYINFPTAAGQRGFVSSHHDDSESEEYTAESLRAAGGSLVQPPGGRFGRPPGPDTEENPALKSLNRFLEEARRYRTARSATDTGLPPFARDAKLEAMLPVLAGTLPVVIQAEQETDIRRAVAWAKQNGLKVILTGAREADKCADLLVQNSIPVIIGPVLELPTTDDAAYDQMYALPGSLSKAGVKVTITAGTDGDGEMTRRLAHHAAMAAAFGLSHDEAVRAITLYPAQVFGVADRLGSLEVGKDATLIVTSGDILEIVSDVRAAWIKGLPVSLTNKQTRLYDKYRGRPKSGETK